MSAGHQRLNPAVELEESEDTEEEKKVTAAEDREGQRKEIGPSADWFGSQRCGSQGDVSEDGRQDLGSETRSEGRGCMLMQTHDEAADLVPEGAAFPETLIPKQAVEDGNVQNNEDEHRQNETIFEEEWLQADQKLIVMNISGKKDWKGF